LISDFGVGRKVAGVEAMLYTQLAGGFAFGGVIFGFGSFVHHSRCEQRDLLADSYIRHVRFSPRI
jgi:hypothetical protein